MPLRPAYDQAGPRSNSPSLDRLDPAKGYVPGNVVVVSNRANQLKSNLTPDEMILVGLRFRELERAAQTQRGRNAPLA